MTISRVAVAFGCVLTCAHAADPTSPAGNVEAVCEYVSNGLENYGERLLRFPLPPSCQKYQGIGEEVLFKFGLQSQSCYQALSGPLCALQFSEYEASSTCKSTLDLFTTLIETCSNKNVMAATYSDCVSYDPNTRTISNPEAFCKSSFLRVDKGESPEGTSAGFEKKTFGQSEIMDCKRIAENFNACQIVGVGLLGYSNRFCMGKGFPAYCQKYPTVVRDGTFTRICKNLVIPYLLESNRRLGTKREINHCDGIYENYLMFLKNRKDAYSQKAEAAKESLESMKNSSEMFSSFKRVAQALSQDNDSLERDSTEVLNQFHQMSSQNMAFDAQILTEFQNLGASLAAAEQAATVIEYPEMTENAEENIKIFAKESPSIESLDQAITKSSVSVKNLEALIAQGGHVSYSQAYGFYPIELASIEELRTRIKKMSESLKPFTTTYSEEVLALEEPPQPGVDASFLNAAQTFGKLNDIYGEQMALLTKLQRYGSQTGNVFTAASRSFK